MTDWRRVLLEAAEAAQKACDSAGKGGRGYVGVGASGDKTIVADRDAEAEILRVLKGADDLRIVSEEAGELGPSQSELTAIVDPVDGSANYERGIPFYCTAIAIVKGGHLEDTSHAVVRNLVNGDVYYAEKGGGATKNGKPIASSKVDSLSKAFLGMDVSRATRETVVGLASLIAASRRQLHYGANALELCLMAEGVLDAFVDVRGKMRVTDFAAAFLIAREAGAVLTAPDGGSLDPSLDLRSRFSFVGAGNPTLHGEILSYVKGSSP